MLVKKLEHDAPVDGEGPDGGTTLMTAANRGSEGFVNLFLDWGACVCL